MIVGAAALLTATTALAQTAPAAGTEVEGVVVTGSRIPQPNLTSVSPIQVVTSEEYRLQGQTDTIDLLNDLPQVSQNDVSTFSSTSNPLSGPGGISNIDLRGLGPQRTLVLVDGRRLGVGDPNTGNTNPSPDINQIPSQLIERVDVLTGGASAVYGSDAIAGVVNFVMRRNFTGLQVDAQYGISQHTQHGDLIQGLQRARGYREPESNVWDGAAKDVSIILGANSADGNGNVTAFFTYHDQEPVSQADRDFSACQLKITGAGVPFCNGSSNSNIFYTSDGQSDAFSVLGRRFIPYDSAPTTPPSVFNSSPFQYLQHQDTRYTGGFFAHYEVNSHADVYGDFSFMNDRSSTIVAPSGFFQGSGVSELGGFLVNCNNPLLSAQQAATFCTGAQIAAGDSVDLTIGRRNVEGGGRQSDYEHTNYRAVLGARGVIAGPWRYDVYGQYYYTSFTQGNFQYLSLSRLQNALQVRSSPGGPVCISGGTCVPLNIFADGGVNQAQLNYVNSSAFETGSVAQTTIEGTITGDLGAYGWKTPWANDGLGIALGATNRRDHLVFTPDEASLSGDLSGFGGAATAINNTLRVNEFYGELRAPLIQDRRFAHEVILELGYRYSNYSTGINADTYKVGLQWAPVEAFRMRGSYQSAIRAPGITELYTPQAVTNTSDPSSDPCAPTDSGTTRAAATLAQCQRTGVTVAQYGNGFGSAAGGTNTIVQCPADQCAILLGGNSNLSAEQAKTYSVGFTFRPTSGFLDGLTTSVDYYNIKLTNTVGALGGSLILNNCLTTGDAQFCSLVHRASNGTIFGTTLAAGYVVGTNVNIGAGQNSGIDVQASYSMPLDRIGLNDWGRITLGLAGSYLLQSTVTPLPGEPTYDCAGLFGPKCQTLNPRWRSNVRLTWQMPWHLQSSINWRYIGGTLLESQSTEPTIGGGPPELFNRTLPARNYIDLSVQWTPRERITIRSGIQNVFDQDPPLVASALPGTGLPNSYSSYDLTGRRLFIGFTAGF